MNHNERSLKVLLLGESGVGKSAICHRLCKDSFTDIYTSTIGVEYAPKYIDLENNTLKVQLWDSAGQERFKNITRCYYRSTNGVILVFDMTQRESFNKVVEWYDDVMSKSEGSRPVVYIVGNKSDLSDKICVSEKEIDKLSERLNSAKTFFCSAKSGKNVIAIFRQLAADMVLKEEKVCFEEPETVNESTCRLNVCTIV
ncbi:hypothetical protein EIN_480990 [Entamoeba invadens IP1]|uniref:Uncharacterized protein n=1 Tax=Entamoeba invadens IP1 TaxID=370355 RepID=L7FMA1_ENTIV|nr:hypothetical protein EIN_480990 [Entamoeba invadens IP1]ELP91160.1 hypothetical protein EIN_480990 [Entamoeba invadens IP1]|eukprot:XP_004257931.1 hypothetical protein EIN_480990 [Entamoeba invadens IP1]